MKGEKSETGEDQNVDIVHLGTRQINQADPSPPSMDATTAQRDQRSAARKSEASTKALAANYGEDSDEDELLGQASKRKQGTGTPVKSTNKRTMKDSTPKKTRKPRARKELTYEEYYDKFDQQNAAIERWKKKLGTKTEKLDRVLVTLQSERSDNTIRFETLEEELSKSRKLVNEQEERIGKLQSERVDTLGSGEHAALPDNVVQGQYTSLFRESKSWSDTWAEIDWNGVEAEQVEQIVEAVKAGRNDSTISELTVEAIRKGKISRRILLNAVVNRLLTRHTMSHAFQFLRTDSRGEYEEEAEDQLEFFFKMVEMRSASDYHQCRVSLMRSVLASQDAATESWSCIKPYIDNLIHRHCRYISDRILEEGRGLLRSCDENVAEERKTELSDLVQAFLQKSLELHAQEPHIKICWRKYLAKFRFALAHEFFVGHRALKLNGDFEEARLAADHAGFLGREIDFVVEPLVLRCGDADGRDLDQHRVVNKAGVWMVNYKDLEESHENKSSSNHVSQEKAPEIKTEAASDSRVSDAASTLTNRAEKPQVPAPPLTGKAHANEAAQSEMINNNPISIQGQPHRAKEVAKASTKHQVSSATTKTQAKKRLSEDEDPSAKRPCVIITSASDPTRALPQSVTSSKADQQAAPDHSLKSNGQSPTQKAYAARKARKDKAGKTKVAAREPTHPIKKEPRDQWEGEDPCKTP